MSSHSSHPASSSDSTSMSGMAMTFTNAHNIPLYSSAWTPTTAGGFAGSCIFLIVLGILSRLIYAYRHILETRWHDRAIQRRYIVLAGENPEDREKQVAGQSAHVHDEATLTLRGVDERVRVLRTSTRGLETQPWRFSVDLPRAAVFTVQAGVAYLL